MDLGADLCLRLCLRLDLGLVPSSSSSQRFILGQPGLVMAQDVNNVVRPQVGDELNFVRQRSQADDLEAHTALPCCVDDKRSLLLLRQPAKPVGELGQSHAFN